jgi:hypothetical protein
MTFSPQPPYPPPAVDRKADSRKQLKIAGIAVGAVLVLIGLVMAGAFLQGHDLAKLDTTVTGCTSTSTVATVQFTITNTGSRSQGATVHVEYRDGTGAQVDTDTTVVGAIQPGDTVRKEESTILDSAPAGGSITCRITDLT